MKGKYLGRGSRVFLSAAVCTSISVSLFTHQPEASASGRARAKTTLPAGVVTAHEGIPWQIQSLWTQADSQAGLPENAGKRYEKTQHGYICYEPRGRIHRFRVLRGKAGSVVVLEEEVDRHGLRSHTKGTYVPIYTSTDAPHEQRLPTDVEMKDIRRGGFAPLWPSDLQLISEAAEAQRLVDQDLETFGGTKLLPELQPGGLLRQRIMLSNNGYKHHFFAPHVDGGYIHVQMRDGYLENIARKLGGKRGRRTEQMSAEQYLQAMTNGLIPGPSPFSGEGMLLWR